MNKRLAGLGAALCLLAGPAFAASGNDAEYGAWGRYNWSGTYIGLNAGYGWNTQRFDFGGGNSVEHDADGALLGGTIGVNADFGEWVAGFEGDLGWAGFRGSSACGVDVTCASKVDALGTARARVGYEIGDVLNTNPLLAYATVGLAFGDTQFKTSGPGGDVYEGKIKGGWTAGGGFEYALGDRWSLKAEYLHIDLNDDNYNVAGGPARGEVRPIELVRGGVNLRF